MPLTALALALAAAFVHALSNLLLARARVAVAAFAFPAAALWHVDGLVWPYVVGRAARRAKPGRPFVSERFNASAGWEGST